MDTPGTEDRESLTSARDPNGAFVSRDMLATLGVYSRLFWFLLGAIVATSVTVAVLRRPVSTPVAAPALPYEGLPFADNAGVCQEFVALAELATSHADAQATATRLAQSLPAGIRPDNLRVVRAFAPGDQWTVAVDTQPGAGDLAHANTLSESLNHIAGFGLRFSPIFYGSRKLYESAHVLCMPRGNVESP